MAKLISNLKVGDKVFIINTLDLTFDVAEVIEIIQSLIKIQCYFHNKALFLWKFHNVYHIGDLIIFTDENEAIEEFKFILKHNQDGRNR